MSLSFAGWFVLVSAPCLDPGAYSLFMPLSISSKAAFIFSISSSLPSRSSVAIPLFLPLFRRNILPKAFLIFCRGFFLSPLSTTSSCLVCFLKDSSDSSTTTSFSSVVGSSIAIPVVSAKGSSGSFSIVLSVSDSTSGSSSSFALFLSSSVAASVSPSTSVSELSIGSSCSVPLTASSISMFSSMSMPTSSTMLSTPSCSLEGISSVATVSSVSPPTVVSISTDGDMTSTSSSVDISVELSSSKLAVGSPSASSLA
mmetsp:Transcript_12331/g.22105  ORF Transcript_12331/g.22105 Transcript_12331/m.22105 type:complete len:256 (-) Transcript_12331:158-925(-)